MTSFLAAILRFFRWLWSLFAGRPATTPTTARLIRFCRVPLARRKDGHRHDLVKICTPADGATVATTFTVEGQFDGPDTSVTVTVDGVPGTTTVDTTVNPHTFKTVFTGVAPGAGRKVKVVGDATGNQDGVTVTVMKGTTAPTQICLGVSDAGGAAQYLQALRVERGDDKPGEVGFSLEVHGAKTAAFEVGYILPDAGDTLVDHELGERRIAAPTYDGTTWVASYAGVKPGSYTIQIEGADGVKDKVVIEVSIID